MGLVLSHSLRVLIIPASIVYFYSVLAKSRLQERSAILINKVSADDDEFVTLYVASDRTDEREGLT